MEILLALSNLEIPAVRVPAFNRDRILHLTRSISVGFAVLCCHNLSRAVPNEIQRSGDTRTQICPDSDDPQNLFKTAQLCESIASIHENL